MGSNRQVLARQAMLESIEVRDQNNRQLDDALDVYTLCKDMGVKVRFVSLASMEGIYGRDKSGAGNILLSSLRPLPRRSFSCAHELGHHVFGHGSSVDEFVENAGSSQSKTFQPHEFLADTFAAFLLMPTLGVRKAFASRDWDPTAATPVQIFAVACHFGVGYETLIGHLLHSLNSISWAHAHQLTKTTPKLIRTQLLGKTSPDPLVVADMHWESPTLDVEVGTTLLLPFDAVAEGVVLSPPNDLSSGRCFTAVRPGISRVTIPGTQWAIFVRVARFQFAGLAEYRHLELEDDDE